MAINKKFIHFKKKSTFDTQNNQGNILDTSIVFIQDAKQIWTHGALYDCESGGLFKTAVVRNSFTQAQWTNTYGSIGHSETWSDTKQSRNGCDIDDIFAVMGKDTSGNGHIAFYKCTNKNDSSLNLVGTCIGHVETERGESGISNAQVSGTTLEISL